MRTRPVTRATGRAPHRRPLPAAGEVTVVPDREMSAVPDGTMPDAIGFGREVTGELAVAERREWLCTNGIGGFASGTVAGVLTRRYHGLLTAALAPPLGRTLLVAKLEETVAYEGERWELGTNRWAGGAVAPLGHRLIESFRLDGTTPVWTFALGDALLERRVWMEQGANTTYVRYHVRRGSAPLALALDALVNYREYHATTRGDGWQMAMAPDGAAGMRVEAYPGARPFRLLAPGARCEPAHSWYQRYALALEAERGLDASDDHLHAATFTAVLAPGESLTVILSAEEEPDVDGAAAWGRRTAHEAAVLETFARAHPAAAHAPAWIRQLALAADQFVVSRTVDGVDGASIIAGYPWFGDWGRDAMIALPGLLLSTGRAPVAARILETFARFADRGMLPNRFPDAGETPEYNTADATLWYVEAIRAYHAVTGDDALVARLWPTLEAIAAAHRTGTRHGIGEDPSDGLLRAGEPGQQLTWMDARVDGREITPRIGKPVEINALWYNALRALAALAVPAGRAAQAGRWSTLADRVARSFGRFWNPETGCCFDVIDGPGGGADGAIRPNQLLAVSLAATALDRERARLVVETCARHLLTSYGLRSLSPHDPQYAGRSVGGPAERDGRYHQGTVWAWLLGPFALAQLAVSGDHAAARAVLEPMAHHLVDVGLGSIAEIFDGDPPFTPRGCPAQAWSVAEVLRAWLETAP